MSRLGAEAWLVAAAIWVSIMLPSAAFGCAPSDRSPGNPVTGDHAPMTGDHARSF